MPRKSRYTISTVAGPVAAPDSQTHATLHTDGTHDTGANTSSAQRHARVPPPPHSGNGARQSRVNAIPFRPPRNEAQLAPSSDIGDARAHATSKKHPDLHEVVDDHSEDEDYDPEVDEVESLFPLLENGVTYCMELIVKEALALPPGKKIVLNHNRELQQVGQAAGLLSEFLGTLASDFQQLPICEKSWKTMSKASKEHAFDKFKRVFHYEDDGRGIIKRGIVQRIGSSWRNARNHLFRKEKCKKNFINRSKQLYTHTRDSKTMARKRHEEVINLNSIPECVNPDLTYLQKAIEHIESQDPSSKEFSQNDFLAQVLGKEHPGRVRGLNFGPCPSQCFRNITQQSNYGVQIEEYQMEIVKLKAE
ncbi:hypothetical protein Ahy_B03g065655 [Arachis hypogaea]|uniref:Uncharacterized protein n=1 Tax=Arachis hypogaea TaxID=3818 RepID=A0A445A281_ARAHY|nr:hypothetical protein Ahy_B03g065655 [Arachis hypogaea]